jgi:predicted nucleotidyltransferase
MHFKDAVSHCIFRYVSGSQQYGTNRPDSDEDLRGVFIAPLNKHFDLFQSSFVGSGTIKQSLQAAIEAIGNGETHNAIHLVESALQTDRGDLRIGVETVSNPDPNADEELHELRKFLKLAADCNPSIIEFLYIDNLIKLETDVWKKIKSHRDWFLSKKARWTFSGYSASQMSRIRTHRGYLLNPPKAKPKRSDFGLPEETVMQKEHQNAILSIPDEWVSDSAKEYVRNEKRFATALQEWNSYCKWERERNPYRKELEKKWGFDLKHASHLVRLSRMCKEILRDGVVLVRRPDAEELKGILRGEWKYEDIEKVANNLDAEVEELYRTSPLQESPQRKKIAELYKEICEERYGIKLRGD